MAAGGRKFTYVVYKITFPNGKIYIGKDIGRGGHSIRYFGSWSASLVESEFTKDQLMDFTIRREILFESPDRVEVSKKEIEFIISTKANDPRYGYNRTPRLAAPLVER
ncbi:hypothetical protein DDE20_04800 [Pararhodobacter oceanensis]|uniref:GIY-YIG domain-containing protein n=2 Tax=Pararhodobacter oceanensis TaxID=2172121 RepID=A0A2T8HWZ4_9RHOB|nr:hypothetical protein DDE20_04800 [Pararhodobacter oceanensis]